MFLRPPVGRFARARVATWQASITLSVYATRLTSAAQMHNDVHAVARPADRSGSETSPTTRVPPLSLRERI